VLLALSVISHQSQLLGAASYKVFDSRGGSIGRIEGNDWVLPDPERLVSSRHANIRFAQGVYYLEDVSTNGTGFNSPQSVVPRDRLQPLADGDRLFIGDFEVLVQVLAEADAPPPEIPNASLSATAQLAALRLPSGGGALGDLLAEPAPIMAPPAPTPVPVAIPEPILTRGPAPAPAPSHVPPPAPAPMVARAPAPPVPGTLPENWDVTGFKGAQATPNTIPIAPAPVPLKTTAAASADVATLLSSLGLQPQQVPPETVGQLGQILRVVVHGIMEVLQARKQVKDNFRMAMTIIRPVENNPLKFAPTPEDALYTLFVKRNPGYLAPVEAFREAFDDLSFHQLATLAGMRAAFFATLQRFDPEALEAQWEKAAGKKRGGFMGLGKAGYWDNFRQHYSRVAHDSEANFQQIFGEAFVRAYDDQIRKLQSARSRDLKTS